MTQWPSAFSCHLSSVASSEVPLAWTAKSTMVVVPPQAAARVPVSNVSTENVPPNGISMWVCTSIPPGRTYSPVASIIWPAAAAQATAVSLPGAASALIRSPSTSTSAGEAPVGDTTVPPLMSVLTASLLPGAAGSGRHCVPCAAGSRLHQRSVLVRAAVAVELPQVPHLGQLVHVQVADDHLVVGVRRGLADQLAARVHEVGLAVE